MPKQVRVKDPDSGVEFTTNEVHAESAGLTVLDKPAVDSFGRDIPVKYPLDLSGLTSRTVSELHEYADERFIDLGDSKKKSEIVAAIEAAESQESN